MTQTFLSDTISRLDTPSGAACVASAPIDLEAARYVGPEGAETLFETVRRSRAASVQLLHPLDDGAPRLRVQLKYPVDKGRPVRLEIGDADLDAARFLEPAGDSLRIAEPGTLARLRAALAPDGPGAGLVAVSADTGRRIEDRLPALDLAGLADCLKDGAGPRRTPRRALSVAFEAAPTPKTQQSPAEARSCAMDDPGGSVHRGRLLGVTGFLAQTRTVHVVFGPDGAPARLYVPGVFDATRAVQRAGDPLRLETPFVADVSVAADRNDPLAPARAKGCLGSSATALCLRPAGEGTYALGPCVTAQPVAKRPGPFALPEPAYLNGAAFADGLVPAPVLPFVVGGGSESDTPSPDLTDQSLLEGSTLLVEADSFRPREPSPPLRATPLPAGGLLLAAGMIALLLRRRRAG